jgi:hypothetical protein
MGDFPPDTLHRALAGSPLPLFRRLPLCFRRSTVSLRIRLVQEPRYLPKTIVEDGVASLRPFPLDPLSLRCLSESGFHGAKFRRIFLYCRDECSPFCLSNLKSPADILNLFGFPAFRLLGKWNGLMIGKIRVRISWYPFVPRIVSRLGHLETRKCATSHGLERHANEIITMERGGPLSSRHIHRARSSGSRLDLSTASRWVDSMRLRDSRVQRSRWDISWGCRAIGVLRETVIQALLLLFNNGIPS